VIKIDLERLERLQLKMFTLIDREIRRVGHHKSYEGQLTIHLGSRFSEYAPYFELDCYVCPVIDGRSCTFETLDEFEELLHKWQAVGFDEETEQYIYPEENKL
jgi:hypothetical protein